MNQITIITFMSSQIIGDTMSRRGMGIIGPCHPPRNRSETRMDPKRKLLYSWKYRRPHLIPLYSVL